jgi:uncharacterized SAM-dependent methyltransferase
MFVHVTKGESKIGGFSGESSGTNIVHHTMATLTRQTAGLDASQAILRHTSSRMSEHYAQLDVNKKVSEVMIETEELIHQAQARVCASKCDQNENE